MSNQHFTISNNLYRATRVRPYERTRDDPLYRPLRIYTLDPAASRFAGAVATANVPYEPLEPGPKSALLEVVDFDQYADCRYRRVDLDDPRILIRGGLSPSATDHFFHQQMVYAVAMQTYAAFSKALGRSLHWGFDRDGDGPVRLRIYPHWNRERNAYYDGDAGALKFGYFSAERVVSGRNLPGGTVFTCLSHDVVAHETTHALLDGLRPHFIQPTNPDALALHEALGDLVAIFQHFSYEEVVRAAIAQARGQLTGSSLLTDMAAQFGQTIGKGGPLRSSIDVQRSTGTGSAEPQMMYNPKLPPHDLGTVLLSALFDAFNDIFQRKTRDLVRLATGGTCILAEGELPITLQSQLARHASTLASQFLSICIRAIDYCPPVDVNFGDYLRALLTADFDLIPDDPWGYREALVDAFRRRGIYPSDVDTLTEDALLWKPPARQIRRSSRLSYKQLGFWDPSNAMDRNKLFRQANELGELISHPAYANLFGIVRADDPCLKQNAEFKGDRFELPSIESIRTSHRVGPDGQVVFDLIAEVVQTRWVEMDGRYPFLGGSTIIFGPDGDVRYSITKHVLSKARADGQRAFLNSTAGGLWVRDGSTWKPTLRAC